MALTAKQRKKGIEDLEEAIVNGLAKRLKSEDASAADFKLAWDICKDVGVLANFNVGHGPSQELLEDLPPLPDVDDAPLTLAQAG